MRETFVKRLEDILFKNKKIHLITADLGFGVFDNFQIKYPKNFLNVGVCEQNMISVASGISSVNKNIVFTYSIGNFATLRCLEQIRQDVCYQNKNVNIVSIGAGFSYGSLGGSHHMTEDIAIMRALPNIKVFVPSDDAEIRKIVDYVSTGVGPTYIRLDKSKPKKYLSNKKFDILKPRLIKKGRFGYIFCSGGIVVEAISALEKFNKIYNKKKNFFGLVTFPNLSSDICNFLKKIKIESKKIIVLEEHFKNGGIYGKICEDLFSQNLIPKKILSFSVKNSKFTSVCGDQNFLRKINNIDSENIFKKLKKIV